MRRGILFGFEIAGILTMVVVLSSPAWAYEEFLDQMKKECEQEAGLGPPGEDSGPSKDIVVDCDHAAAKEKLKGLIGRLRALKETKDLLLRDVRILDCAKNKCAAKYWRTLPSWANSATGLATSVAPGMEGTKAAEWAGWANMGYDVLLDRTEGTTWAGIGGAALETDKASGFVSDYLVKSSIEDATRRANDYFIATGDMAGAQRIFHNSAGVIPDTGIALPTAGKIQKGAKWAGIIISLYDYIQTSTDLVDSYFARHDANLESKKLKGEINKLDAQVEDVLKQIAELRERCKPCPTKGYVRNRTGQCISPCLEPTEDCKARCPKCACAGTCR